MKPETNKPILNDAQKAAVNTPVGNNLVGAGAGSGKTFVLTQRIVHEIIENNTDINSFLIVTFTVNAAAEMRAKINKALLKAAADESDSEKKAFLKKQIMLIPSADICTIDSFCSKVVRDNFDKAGVSPDFLLLSPSDDAQMQLSVADKLTDDLFDRYSDDPDFLSLYYLLANDKNDSELPASIIRMHSFASAFIDPKKWLAGCASKYENNGSIFYDIIFDHLSQTAHDALTELEKLSDTYDFASDVLQSDMDFTASMIKSFSSKDISSLPDLSKPNFARFAANKGIKLESEDPEKKAVIAGRNAVIGQFKKGKSADNLISLMQSMFTASDMQHTAVQIKMLSDACIEFENRLTEQKKEIQSFAFDDIAHMAYGIIESNEGLYDYSEVFIDEYQDTNELQDKIFEKVARGKRFMVGDVKQSIYGFRKAMPEIFIGYREAFEKDSSKGRYIAMNENFRCAAPVIDAVNDVFKSCMTKESGGVDYSDPSEQLIHAKNDDSSCTFKDDSVEYNALNTSSGNDGAAQSAAFAASQVKDLLENGVKDGKKIKRSDICILTATNRELRPYKDALNKALIPCHLVSDDDLFSTYDTALLLSLLKVIDDPSNDVEMLSVMLSPLYGISPDEAAEMRLLSPHRNLYTALRNYDSDSKLYNDIKKYRHLSVTKSVSELLNYICADLDAYSLICAMDEPSQRTADINALISLADTHSESTAGGLSSFLRYLDKISESSGTAAKPYLSSAGDCVNLMTVHKSKGLEWEAVIIAGNDADRTKVKNSNLLFDAQLGAGQKYYEVKEKNKYETVSSAAFRIKSEEAQIAELKRVLYVAMTRARTKLIFDFSTEGNHDISKKLEKSSFAQTSYFNITLPVFLEKNAVKLTDLTNITQSDLPAQDSGSIKEKTDQALYERIKKAVDFVYPYNEISNMPSKFPASKIGDELEPVQDKEYYFSSKPAFMCDGSLTAAQKGTATHKFMQFADYDKAENDVHAELFRLCDGHFLSASEAGAVDTEKISEFFASELYQRIKKADKIYREQKFAYLMSVCDADPSADIKYKDETVLVQGIADCIIEEHGVLTIIDYKTDRVKNVQTLKDHYSRQLEIYADAFGKCMEKPVKEKLLYSFELNQTVNI